MSKEVKRVNMNGSQDPYYRYTMPCISVKVEGTTKMIKSVLVNIDEVCRAVGRPPDYMITYLGQELSANSKIEKDTCKAYVTGNFEERKVQELIFKFITDTVTCEKCKNPETTCNIEGKKKSMSLYLTCKGCGGRTDLNSADRFVKYMILHPPTDVNYGHAKSAAGSVGAVMADLTKMDEEKKKKKAKKEEDGEGGSSDDDKKEKKKKKKKEKERDEDDDEEDGEKKEKKDKKEKKKKKDKDREGDSSPEDGDDKDKKDKKEKKKKSDKKKDKEEKENDSWDDEWGDDTSDAAVDARKAALAGGKDAKEQEDKMDKMAAKMDKLMEKSAAQKKDSSSDDDADAPTAAAGDDSDSDLDLDDI
mmetsp:Transcript_21419/g.34299  ORF Transcript_21419/g.34299 Transcript_21419/m.34299 type:complete len:361 (+) Transcript_21419:386-1468(+)